MKQVISLFVVLFFTSAAFATNDDPGTTTETGSKTKKEDPLKENAKEEVASPQVTLFNFSLFSFPTVDTVPTISTFGSTDRFRKASCTPSRF